MCCFSNEVSYIGETCIFVRGEDDGSQYIVYSMAYETAVDLAMILPLPTPPHAPADAVSFVDLSAYPEFFDDLHANVRWPITRGLGAEFTAKTLAVHEVGSFEASFAPHQDDFARLDPRFRIAPELWRQLPLYDDYGFAVFKLKPGAKKVHPMALRFPRRDPGQLFFPTVHIHHNKVEAVAHFDHELYLQRRDGINRLEPHPHVWGEWSKTDEAHRFMDIERAHGIVDPSLPVLVYRVAGNWPNQDILFPESFDPLAFM